jgi:LysR family transcriptional regulator, cell division regulator
MEVAEGVSAAGTKAMIGRVWDDGQVGVHPLPGKEGVVETVFARRHDAYMSSALRVFLEMARGNVPHSVAAE